MRIYGGDWNSNSEFNWWEYDPKAKKFVNRGPWRPGQPIPPPLGEEQEPENKAEESLATDERYPTLRVADRCDRCGAQAYVRVVVPPDEENPRESDDLLFCAHHFRKHEEAIVVEHGYEVLDERHKIPKGGPSL